MRTEPAPAASPPPRHRRSLHTDELPSRPASLVVCGAACAIRQQQRSSQGRKKRMAPPQTTQGGAYAGIVRPDVPHAAPAVAPRHPLPQATRPYAALRPNAAGRWPLLRWAAAAPALGALPLAYTCLPSPLRRQAGIRPPGRSCLLLQQGPLLPHLRTQPTARIPRARATQEPNGPHGPHRPHGPTHPTIPHYQFMGYPFRMDLNERA